MINHIIYVGLAFFSAYIFNNLYFGKQKQLYYINQDKYYTSHKYASYYTSFIHAIYLIIVGFATIYELYDDIHKFDIESYWFNYYVSISIGYFVFDLMHLLMFTPASFCFSNIIYYFHHVGFICILYYLIFQNSFHGASSIVLLVETSTIFLNSFHYFSYLSKKYPTVGLYKVLCRWLFNLFVVLFVFFRIINVAFVLYYFWEELAMCEVLRSVGYFILILNTIWLVPIIRLLKKLNA